MKGRPVKVSLIVPVYNVEKYLSDCMNSCISQTLYDIEILCVNDGSTDNSRAILEAFAAKDHRIRIIDKKNGGLSSARNAGMREAYGDIIMFLDSDDRIAPNACERVWRETMEGAADIVIFGSTMFPLNPAPDNWLRSVLTVRTHRSRGFKPGVLFHDAGAKPFVWRQAFTRTFLEKTGVMFNEDVRFGEDIVFQMEIFPQAKNFAFISDNLYDYRWYREGSLMSGIRKDRDEKMRMHLNIIEVIAEYWRAKGWLGAWPVEFLEWMLEFVVADVRSDEVLQKDEHLKNLYALIKKYGLEGSLSRVRPVIRPLARTLRAAAKAD